MPMGRESRVYSPVPSLRTAARPAYGNITGAAWREVMAFDAKKQIERDILEAVNTHGMLLPTGTPAVEVLTGKYKSEEERQRVTAFASYLIEQRYLFPLFDSDGKEDLQTARDITPKGQRRLQELRHPIGTWIGANWFAVFVAFVTAVIGIASIVSDWTRS